MTQQITTELTDYLANRFPALETPLGESTALLENGAVDSLGILEIVGFLSDRFGVEIDDEEFEPDNFATVGAIANMVSRKISA